MKRISLLFCFLLLCQCTGKPKPEDAPVQRLDEQTIKLSPDAIQNVKVTTAELLDFPEQLKLMGRIAVVEDRMAVVPARVSGRIDSVFIASGEPVKKGTPLAGLFSADFAAAKEEYLQSMRNSNSVVGDPSGFGGLTKLARKKLENMGLNASDIDRLAHDGDDGSPTLIIRSPRDGFIIDKKAIVGNFANVGDTLFTVADLNKVWFSGDLYPEDLSKVHKDQEVTITPEGSSLSISGRVSFISPVVDPVARTIKIRALMTNPGSTLRADMYVQGNIILNKKRLLVIPTNALVHLDDKEAVFKRLDKERFRKVEVKTADSRNGQTAVLSGLNAGDQVVSEGALLLDAALKAELN